MWNKRVGKYPLKTYSVWWFILDLFLQGLIVSPALYCNDILPNNPLPLFGITGYTGLLQLGTVKTWNCRNCKEANADWKAVKAVSAKTIKLCLPLCREALGHFHCFAMELTWQEAEITPCLREPTNNHVLGSGNKTPWLCEGRRAYGLYK